MDSSRSPDPRYKYIIFEDFIPSFVLLSRPLSHRRRPHAQMATPARKIFRNALSTPDRTLPNCAAVTATSSRSPSACLDGSERRSSSTSAAIRSSPALRVPCEDGRSGGGGRQRRGQREVRRGRDGTRAERDRGVQPRLSSWVVGRGAAGRGVVWDEWVGWRRTRRLSSEAVCRSLL